jgi:hypothetical protein
MIRNYTYNVVYKRPPLTREFVLLIEAKNTLEAAFIAGHSFLLAVDVDLISVELK